MLLVGTTLLCLVGQVDPLARATAAFEALEFDAALEAAPAPETWAGFSRETVVRVLALRALSLASIKRDGEAKQVFRQVLTLEPLWQLPEQFGPRVRTMVLEAKDDVARDGPLQVVLEAGQIRVKGNGFQLPTELEIVWRVSGQVRSLRAAPERAVPVPWPSSDSVEAWLTLRGPAGSILVTKGTEAAPVQIAGAPLVAPLPPARSTSTAVRTFGIVGAALGVVVVVAGVAVGLEANRPADLLSQAARDSMGRITSPTQRAAFAADAAAADASMVGGGLLIGGLATLVAGAVMLVASLFPVAP